MNVNRKNKKWNFTITKKWLLEKQHFSTKTFASIKKCHESLVTIKYLKLYMMRNEQSASEHFR